MKTFSTNPIVVLFPSFDDRTMRELSRARDSLSAFIDKLGIELAPHTRRIVETFEELGRTFARKLGNKSFDDACRRYLEASRPDRERASFKVKATPRRPPPISLALSSVATTNAIAPKKRSRARAWLAYTFGTPRAPRPSRSRPGASALTRRA